MQTTASSVLSRHSVRPGGPTEQGASAPNTLDFEELTSSIKANTRGTSDWSDAMPTIRATQDLFELPVYITDDQFQLDTAAFCGAEAAVGTWPEDDVVGCTAIVLCASSGYQGANGGFVLFESYGDCLAFADEVMR